MHGSGHSALLNSRLGRRGGKRRPRPLPGIRGFSPRAADSHKRSSKKSSLTARSRGTNRRCPIPRSSSTRQAYSFTSLFLSSCMSWDFLAGGVSLAAGAGQGAPSSMSRRQVSRVRQSGSLTMLTTAAVEPGSGLPGGCTS